jgi:hypothetical protein
VETNPYHFKLSPGYNREIIGPVYLEVLMLLKKLSATQKLLDDENMNRLDALERKPRILNEGAATNYTPTPVTTRGAS